MDLMSELSKPRTKNHAKNIAESIVQNPHFLDPLMEIYFGDDKRVTQNAAYFLMYVSEKNPELMKPFVVPIIENLSTNPPATIKRNSVRILQSQKIPEKNQGKLYNICFQYLTSAQEPIAVKAFSMTVLANLAKVYPELSNELIPIIEELIKYGSPGLKSRGKKVLATLKRL